MGKYWRTNFWYRTIRFLGIKPIVKKFNFRSAKCKLKPPFIVLCNHTTDYDAMLIASAFREPIHFVMSDHVSSIPVAGKLINHLVDTIPITKSTIDVRTVKKMYEVAKNGGALGLFPEGNKSFSGSMSAVKPSISKLLKKLNIPVVIYTIEGGYFSSPRWSKIKRKGFTSGKISCIIEPEELEKLSNEELYQKVMLHLSIDAYKVQANRKIEFVGKDLTRGIENLLYMCPKCGSLSTVYGEYNHIKCHNCDLLAEMDNYGYISGAPFTTLTDWDAWQKSELYKLNLKENTTTPILSDSGFVIKQKETSYKNKLLGKFGIELFYDRFVFSPEDNKNMEQIILPLTNVAGYAIEGPNGMQLWTKDNVIYRLKNDNNVSGLKYVNCMCALLNQEMHF